MRTAHDQDDNGEGGPAPYPIAQVAPEHPSYGTRQERNAVECERRDYGRSAIPFGKEEGGNDRDRVRVDREVVPLHKVANTPRRQCPYGPAGASGRLASSIPELAAMMLSSFLSSDPSLRVTYVPRSSPFLKPAYRRHSYCNILILWLLGRATVFRRLA